jgi:hypothetical protein
MMGEGMSGVYLNVMSGIVRTFVDQLAAEFDWYVGESVQDADVFIAQHHDLIQEFLDDRRSTSFDARSSQSGDDVVDFNDFAPGVLRRYFILFYRILGLIPSESTLYSSDSFGTFTEESCYRDNTTLGWVFLDCLKPRLFSPESSDGLQSVLSRIRQITSNLRYQSDDQDLVHRVSYCVDLMISSNPVIFDRIRRYELVPSFPEFMGGLDHPSSLEDDIQFDIPDVDRSTVVYLKTCSDDELFDIKYHWITSDMRDDESSEALRKILLRVVRLFSELTESLSGSAEPLTYIKESTLADRSDYVGWAEYHRDLRSIKRNLGLGSLDEIIEAVSNGYRLQLMLHGDTKGDQNPMIRLRNRREFLISKARDSLADPHAFMWKDLRSVSNRLNLSFGGRITVIEDFLEVLGLDELPNLTCPVQLSMGGEV